MQERVEPAGLALACALDQPRRERCGFGVDRSGGRGLAQPLGDAGAFLLAVGGAQRGTVESHRAPCTRFQLQSSCRDTDAKNRFPTCDDDANLCPGRANWRLGVAWMAAARAVLRVGRVLTRRNLDVVEPSQFV